MLSSSTLDFLRKLKKNNNKEWFDENRKTYETAKKDFEGFVNNMLSALSKTVPAYKEQKAKDCIFRIFRDVRFSKDKAPYKPNFGAVFSKNGKKMDGGGYYVHIEPGSSFIGGGIWMPHDETIQKIRQEIDYNFKEFQKILNTAAFKKLFPKIDGAQLKRPPKGYDEENPAIEYLKLKSFTVGTPISDKEIMDKQFTKTTLKTFQTMQPFIEFLNRAVS